MRRLFFLMLLVLAPASAASADDCADTATQAAMNECANQAYEKADAELNALYQQIRQRLKGDGETTTLFVAAQRAWVAFRDAECKFSTSGVSGGSIYPTIYAGCLERLTKARVDDFTVYLGCQEGDLSCPVPPQ
jgi:uncharacterized protein YecT (DUF1311 family)